MKKTQKLLMILLMMVVSALVLIGCGAEVDTDMVIDENFAGQRVITLTISNSDLEEEVTGGLTALKKVADDNLPKEMTCTSTPGESESVITFTMKFNDYEDYCTKVESLVDYGSNEGLTPEINYENYDTVFKKGILLDENFDSFDLLQWYFDALKESGVITYSSTSSWYELGSTKVTIEGTEYDTGNDINIDERESYCLSGIEVVTTLNIDGTFQRELHFKASNYVMEELEEADVDLNKYFTKLVKDPDTLTVVEEENNNEYVIAFTAEDAKSLQKKTDTYLQTENKFTHKISVDEKKPGIANVTVTEKLDGSFYLDYEYSYNPLKSTINFYDETVRDSEGQIYDGKTEYSPSRTEEKSFNFDWKIGFDKVELVPTIKSEKKMSLELVFTAKEKMSDELKSSAFEAIKATCGENGKVKVKGDVCTVTFSGRLDVVKEKVNAFIAANDVSEENTDTQYFDVRITKFDNRSKFKNSTICEMRYDFTPVIGEAGLVIDEKGKTDWIANVEIDEEGNSVIASENVVAVVMTKGAGGHIVATIIFILCIVAGAGLFFFEREKIAELFAKIFKKKDKAAPAAESASAPAEENAPADAEVSESVEEKKEETV